MKTDKHLNWELCFCFKSSWHASFEEAFKAMYDAVMSSPTSEQLLEAIWIQKRGSGPIMFWAAKELAYELGLLKDGKPTWKDSPHG